jgi:hypothetical protein
VIGERRWFLGASTEWPGVEPADVEFGNPDALAARYPGVAAEIQLPGASEAIRHAFAGLVTLQVFENAMRFGSASAHGT